MSGVSIALLLIVFAGFVRSYYLRPLFGFRSLPTLLHFHGLVMSLWFVLFLTQAGLISAGRIALHRQLGVFGTFLAASVVILGGDVVIHAARHQFTPFPETLSGSGFFLVNLGILFTFGILFCSAILYRRRGDVHQTLDGAGVPQPFAAGDRSFAGSFPAGRNSLASDSRDRFVCVDMRLRRRTSRGKTAPCVYVGRIGRHLLSSCLDLVGQFRRLGEHRDTDSAVSRGS